MNLREAKEQVERDRPELTGSAKLEAIKALREDRETADDVVVAAPKAAPEPRKPLRIVLTLLVWWTIVGTVLSVVGIFTGIPRATGVFWPAVIHPHWLGAVIGAGAFIVLTTCIGIAGRETRDPQRSE